MAELKNQNELFLDTDIFLEHLHLDKKKKDTGSVLVKALKLFTCYTSVINASEIFAACESKKMIDSAALSFYGVGVLGIPYKYSFRIGEMLSYIKKKA